MVNVLKGLQFLLIIFTVGHLTGEAAPSTIGTFNPHKKHGKADEAMTWRRERDLAKALTNSDLLKRPNRPKASQGPCPYKLKVSEPQYNRTPQHYVEATCEGCDMKRCEPVYYHLLVRIRRGSRHSWESIQVKVAYVNKRLCKL